MNPTDVLNYAGLVNAGTLNIEDAGCEPITVISLDDGWFSVNCTRLHGKPIPTVNGKALKPVEILEDFPVL